MPTTLLEVKGNERDGFEWVVFVVGGKDVVSDEVTGRGGQGQGRGQALLLAPPVCLRLSSVARRQQAVKQLVKLVRQTANWSGLVG